MLKAEMGATVMDLSTGKQSTRRADNFAQFASSNWNRADFRTGA